MKHDSWFQKNGEMDNHSTTPTNEDVSPKQPTTKKKKSTEYQEFFSEEEKQFNEATKGNNLFTMFFS